VVILLDELSIDFCVHYHRIDGNAYKEISSITRSVYSYFL